MPGKKIDFMCPAEGCEYTVERTAAARVRAVCHNGHGMQDFEPDEQEYRRERQRKRDDALGRYTDVGGREEDIYSDRSPDDDTDSGREAFLRAVEDVAWSYQNLHPESRADVLEAIADELRADDSKFRDPEQHLVNAIRRSVPGPDESVDVRGDDGE